MAHTKHKIVRKAAVVAAVDRHGKKKGAKNSDLKQAAHQGRTPVKDARNARSGYAAVPVSVTALPPGQGPQMSSVPAPVGRGRNSKASARSVAAIQAAAAAYAASKKQAGGGRGASSSRARGKRKR